jgi:cell division protein FtsN
MNGRLRPFASRRLSEETNVANPDDPKRPDDPKAPGGTEWVSPRLRAKMYDDEDEEQKKSKSAQNLVALAMLVLVVGLGAALMAMMARGREADKLKAAEQARAAAAEHAADSLRTHVEDSLRAYRADSLAKNAPKVAAKPPAGTAAGTGTASATPAAPPPEPSHYGIAVGTFLTQDRANQEQTKLQGSTGLAGSVSEVKQDNVTQYRVVIGDFTDKKAAETKANELIVAASVREARVIKLPKN